MINKRARIDDSDDQNPMIKIDVGDYRYGFSVRMLSPKDREWLLDVLPRQMQDIHDRAIKETTDKFQKSLRELAGL